MLVQPSIGATLSKLRKNTALTQYAIATKMGADQSRVSRLETGGVSPSETEVRAYLEALGTQEALSYLSHREKDWKFLNLPTPGNPEADAIWKAEIQLQRLHDFEEAKNPPAPVQAEMEMHRNSLLQAAGFLGSLEHDIAFVGPVGVGKTTALCLVADLTIADPTAGLRSKVVLETGGGRMTLCEVQVKPGPVWGVLPHPYPDDEIYRLVGDLCEGLYDAGPDGSESAQKGVPREIDRALRNMAGLARTRPRTPGGKSELKDPAAQLAKEKGGAEELRSEFASRLQLWKRTKRELWYDQKAQVPPKQWLRDIFAKINKGQHSEISLPQRIDILVPEPLLKQTPFTISIVDTRGVDETVIRVDLRTRLDDPRTVICLCSPFNSAPDTGIQDFIEHSIETGLARAFSERVALLILPRPEEASAMKDDTGEPVGTDQEGCDLKLDQVRGVLRRLGVEAMPVLFFNADSDDPQRLSKQLLTLVGRTRESHVDRINSVTTALDRLIVDYEVQAAELTRRSVIKDLSGFVSRNETLPAPLYPVHNLLISAMRTAHARTVWATARRQGGWENLDVYSALGAGAAREATRRSQPFFNGLEERVRIKLEDEELEAAHPFLGEVLVNVKIWRKDYIEYSHSAGQETFRPALQDDLSLWSTCELRWGGGAGYRDEVVQEVRGWFENPSRARLHDALEAGTKDAWRREVIDRLTTLFSDPMGS